MNAPRIELLKLTRKLPSGGRELTILDGVDLTFQAGEFAAVLGPSGSGKSTLCAGTRSASSSRASSSWAT
jgi:putative ABC transport system ATP-binding protein